jgi:hypothetical protein
VRDQYVGDISDVLKFSFLRALAGVDRTLGVAWYYVPTSDGRRDGNHLEWRAESAWLAVDRPLCMALLCLPERSVNALEQAPIWPLNTSFHRQPLLPRQDRTEWAVTKRAALDRADLVFLDPDNGLGGETIKHATFSELRFLRRPGRAIIFITFPGRTMPHNQLVLQLHKRLVTEADVKNCLTLRISVSVPRGGESPSYIPRPRWFTIADPDPSLIARAQAFAAALERLPRVRLTLDSTP